MKDAYTQCILDKAAALTRLETAARVLPPPERCDRRAALAALLGALLAMVPAVSAAQMIL